MTPLLWILQSILIPALSPLGIGIIRKIKARLQNRIGANIFQPYRDLWKLLHKDEIISDDASWIFRFTPFILFAITLVVGISIPLFSSISLPTQINDILVLIYTLSLGTFFLALAGMDTGSSFGGFASSREMTLSALAEGGFLFSLLTMAILCGSSNPFTIAGTNTPLDSPSLFSIFFAFLGFFIILLAETKRFPFDNPATHLELTMIHEAMILEYSGKRLALLEWASANKLLIFSALGVNLFFPWGIAHTETLSATLIGILVFAVKIFVLYVIIAFIESLLAKFRFFRLPDLLFSSFILNCIALGLITSSL